MTQRNFVSQRLFDRFKSIDGKVILGFLARPETSVTSDQTTRRIFNARLPTKAGVGSLVYRDGTKEYFILGLSQDTYPNCKSFKAYQVTEIYSLRRTIKDVDPITGFSTNNGLTYVKDIYTTIEPLKEEKFEGFSANVFHFITNEPLLQGDYVGEYVVKSVTPQLGLYRVVTQAK